MKRSYDKFQNRGQVLVVVLMIVALTATLAGTAMVRVVSDTRQTKELEDKQKADNAAKGIIEQVLNNENPDVATDFSTGSLNTGVAPVNQNPLGPPEFVTQVIPKDSQYIFYNAQYNFAGNSFSPPIAISDLQIFFQSDTGCPVLELIFINTSNAVSSRFVSGACGSNSITGTSTSIKAVTDLTSTPANLSFEGQTGSFSKSISGIALSSTTRMLIVRPIFADTKLGFKRSTPSANLPPQGEYVTATAQSAGGAQTDQKIYRPYPQIPDFFFATSF